MTPLVANFTDDNNDGEVNLCDVPAGYDIVVRASASVGENGIAWASSRNSASTAGRPPDSLWRGKRYAATAEQVVGEALAHLTDGPTHFAGDDVRMGAEHLGAMSRNDAARLMAQMAGASMGTGPTDGEDA